MAAQLTFDLPSITSHDGSDFFVSKSNKTAVHFIEDWERWPSKKFVLSGPKSSGKTHLAHIWAKMSGARIISAMDLSFPDEVSGTNLVVEDVHEIAGIKELEIALFHTHNLLHQNSSCLLMTGIGNANTWPISLPDLASRIEGTSHVLLDAPDDRLFAALLAKQFADRQLFPSPKVLNYLIARLERSYEATRRFVDQADKISLAEGRPLTRAFAKNILSEFTTDFD